PMSCLFLRRQPPLPNASTLSLHDALPIFPDIIKHEENIIYIHGGGWALGDIDTYTRACVNLANHLHRPVYSINYRLAPEYPYPAGFNDCLRVVKVLLNSKKNSKDRKWVLMGDSAGGNLVASVS